MAARMPLSLSESASDISFEHRGQLAQSASDRVALGGFPPRALADPYVLALEHTVPQSWVCCMSVNRMDGSYTRQRVSLERALKADPVERAITVAAIQPLPPPTLNLAQEPG